jgi:hypothetical protein
MKVLDQIVAYLAQRGALDRAEVAALQASGFLSPRDEDEEPYDDGWDWEPAPLSIETPPAYGRRRRRPRRRVLRAPAIAARLRAALPEVTGSFRASVPAARGALGAALRKAGLARGEGGRAEPFDVLDDAEERAMFPGEPLEAIDLAAAGVREAALRAVSLGELRRNIDEAFRVRGTVAGGAELLVDALRTAYRPPWEEALTAWMEAVAPGERTYVRPSRRGADRVDVVLPGRRREGWTMHLVLDTSGSMTGEFPRVLEAVASCCEALRVDQVRVLQCDVEVTRDELVDVSRLQSFPLAGLGGSDLRPAMWRLALDPEVEAAIVITDGYIAYPDEPMPYAVLWAVTDPSFSPPYGKVVPIDAPRARSALLTPRSA